MGKVAEGTENINDALARVEERVQRGRWGVADTPRRCLICGEEATDYVRLRWRSIQGGRREGETKDGKSTKRAYCATHAEQVYGQVIRVLEGAQVAE